MSAAGVAILSFGFFASILGLIGLILSFMDMSEIDAGRMDPNGRGGTQGGRVCAIVGLVLSAVIFFMFFFGRMGRFLR